MWGIAHPQSPRPGPLWPLGTQPGRPVSYKQSSPHALPTLPCPTLPVPWKPVGPGQAHEAVVEVFWRGRLLSCALGDSRKLRA